MGKGISTIVSTTLLILVVVILVSVVFCTVYTSVNKIMSTFHKQVVETTYTLLTKVKVIGKYNPNTHEIVITIINIGDTPIHIVKYVVTDLVTKSVKVGTIDITIPKESTKTIKISYTLRNAVQVELITDRGFTITTIVTK